LEAIKTLIVFILAPGGEPSKQPDDRSFGEHWYSWAWLYHVPLTLPGQILHPCIRIGDSTFINTTTHKNLTLERDHEGELVEGHRSSPPSRSKEDWASSQSRTVASPSSPSTFVIIFLLSLDSSCGFEQVYIFPHVIHPFHCYDDASTLYMWVDPLVLGIW
jgi:hypothetical protein